MDLQAKDIAKRYGFEWIFEGFGFDFHTNGSYAITGGNGSGKSTLLQILSGSLTPSKGSLAYTHLGNNVPIDKVYQYIGLAAPYLEVIEEFSLIELLQYHFRFKQARNNLSIPQIIEILFLENAQHKYIKQYSSGMKQRVKLGLAVLSDTPLLLLDEPTTNLDQNGVNWYRQLISEHTQDRTLLIASNQLHEYDFCKEVINIEEYKEY